MNGMNARVGIELGIRKPARRCEACSRLAYGDVLCVGCRSQVRALETMHTLNGRAYTPGPDSVALHRWLRREERRERVVRALERISTAMWLPCLALFWCAVAYLGLNFWLSFIRWGAGLLHISVPGL